MKDQILKKLFERFQLSNGIPALEETTNSILDGIGDDKNNLKDIVNLVTSDFTITQKVLKLVNSAMYRTFSHEITSVSDAIRIIGHDGLSQIVLSVSIISAFDVVGDAELSKTLLASEIAKTAASRDKNESASIATLLTNIGKLFTNKYLPEETKLIEEKKLSGLDEVEACLQVLEMSYVEVGTEIAKKWKLPKTIVSMIDGTGDPEIIKIAQYSNIASALIKEEKFEEVVALTCETFDNSECLTKLGSFIKTKAIMNNKELSPSLVFEYKPNRKKHIETELKSFLNDITTTPKENLPALVNAVFSELSGLLKTSHCLFFFKNRSAEFVVGIGYGKAIDEIKSKIRISIDGKTNIFQAVIKNNVFVFIDDISKLKEGMLPLHYKTLFPKTSHFMILPIPDDEVKGLLYFDWEDLSQFTQDEFNGIKEVIKEIRDVFISYMK